MPAFRHEALFYAGGRDGFVREVAALVAETLAADGTAAVAARPDRLAPLRTRFGVDQRLRLVDMTDVGANPARIIPVWRELADEARAAGSPFLGVGEPIWADRSGDELDECHRHEALVNLAFADDDVWRLVCPYGVDDLPGRVVQDARLTHPTVVETGGGRSRLPVDGAAAFEAFARPLSPAPSDAATVRFTGDDFVALRELARSHAIAAGLAAERAGDVLLAVTELVTNSVRHGGGSGVLHVWQRPGVVVCQTSDAGRITDPMVGRRRPTPEHLSGRGLWIVHQISDLVQIRDTGRGTVVRVTLR